MPSFASRWGGQDAQTVGPPGLIDNVHGKLQGYTWNLVDGYPLTTSTSEEFHPKGDADGQFSAQVMVSAIRRSNVFAPLVRNRSRANSRCWNDPMFTVERGRLESSHSLVCLFAWRSDSYINVNKQKLHEAGLTVGSWLKDVKQHIWQGKPNDFRSQGRSMTSIGAKSRNLYWEK